MTDFQRRIVRTEFRQDPDGVEGRITAKVLNYNVVDDYETTFAPGVFRSSMDSRMPRIVWSHDWAEPLGRWTRYIDGDDSLTLVGELDDFDAVPRARQAWAQLRSGTIDQFSVGFMPEEAQPAVVDGRDVLTFTRGRLDEASLVLVGAVPGTELLALRSPRSRIVVVRNPSPTVTLDTEALAQILSEVEAGDTTAPAALSLLIDTPSAPAAEDDEPAADAQDEALEPADGDTEPDPVDEAASDDPVDDPEADEVGDEPAAEADETPSEEAPDLELEALLDQSATILDAL